VSQPGASVAIRLTSNLHRNRLGVFGFRVLAPLALREVLPFRELRMTLRTRCPRTARLVAYSLSVFYTVAIARLRKMNEAEQRAAGDALLSELALERDRLIAEHQALEADKAQVTAERERTELKFRDFVDHTLTHGSGPAIDLPPQYMTAFGRNGDDQEDVSIAEVAFEAINAELNKVYAKEAKLLEQFAQLAGKSEAWRLKVEHLEERQLTSRRYEVEKQAMADMAARMMTPFVGADRKLTIQGP